jgi:DNA-binding CsgD family transcriptional regulator
VVESHGLIGRTRERAELDRFLAGVPAGEGSLVLIAGQAGVGKTVLVEDALDRSDLLVLRGAGSETSATPYGPIVQTLRCYLREVPGGLSTPPPLAGQLGLLLPELGTPSGASDRATIFEAIRSALGLVAARGPAALLLDDLQWADATTLELLPTLAVAVADQPLALIGVYRDDEIPRGHPLRRLRNELRRAGALRELTVEPLDPDATATLAERRLGSSVTPALARVIYDRTQGLSFFVEELAAALIAGGRLEAGTHGLALAAGEDVPIPDSVRDAVLVRAAGLSEAAWRTLEVASAAGTRFALDLVAELAGEASLGEPIAHGLIVELESGEAAFRHALAREAVYGEVPWSRRRALHRELATRLESRAAPPAAVAEHWLAARELERARSAFVEAAEQSCGVHAYRDALRATRRALELWPENDDGDARLDLLDRLGACAELAGDFPDATRAWRELADGCGSDPRRLAAVQRRLARIHELQCHWDAAFAARFAAAEAFGVCGEGGEAASERLAAAVNLQAAGRLSPALELIAAAKQQAGQASRKDLTARALGLEGLVLARSGQADAGLEAARAGLSLALARNLTAVAAENYDRLGMVLENASDYRGALDAFTAAAEYCETRGVSDRHLVCLSCLAFLTRKTGEWRRSTEICEELLAELEAPRSARISARGVLGVIHVLRGDVKHARALLEPALADADRTAFMLMRIEATCGLGRAAAQEAAPDATLARCEAILELAREGEDSHAPVSALRWAASTFASYESRTGAAAAAELLAGIAGVSANAEALSALAHALGEVALLEADPETAAKQFVQALDLLRDVELPLERAETQLQAGAALTALGERGPAGEHFEDAYRIAAKLGARPLATRAAKELAALGEPVERRLGRRAETLLQRGGLTRRELQVLRMVSVGRTNREIARELFLSTRTVDMHVRNILTKLGSRSRTDATRKASELGLLEPASQRADDGQSTARLTS